MHSRLLHADLHGQEKGNGAWPALTSRKYITNADIKCVVVPQFPSLALEKVLSRFKRPHPIYEYLPDEVNEFVVNRQFVLDVRLDAQSAL